MPSQTARRPSLPDLLPSRLAGLAVPFAALQLNLLSLAVPVAVLHVYDRIVPNGSSQTLLVLLAGLGLALLLEVVLRAARGALLAGLTARQEHAARQGLVAGLLAARPAALRALPPDALAEALAAQRTLRAAAAQRQQCLVDLPFALLFLGLIVVIGGRLVWVPMAGIALFLLLAWATGRAQDRAAARLREATRPRDAALQGIFAQLGGAKLLGAELALLARLRPLQQEQATALRPLLQHAAFQRELAALFSQLQVALMIGVGALLVLDGRLSMGGLAACTLLSGRALQPLQSALAAMQGWHEARAAAATLRQLSALACEDIAAPPGAAPQGALQLRALRLDRADGTPLLREVTLDLPAGGMAVIRPGRQGEASLLLAALLGLEEPAAGEICFGDTLFGPHNAPALRRQAALVGREAPLMEGSLMENLTEFGDSERQAEAQYLCFLLGLEAAVKRLPGGYETRLDASGRNLPPQIRQSLGLVRALSGRPRLLLLDEAEATLDATAQLRLAGFLKRLKGRATIVAASGSAALEKLADQRWVVQEGRLVPLVPGP